MWIPSKEFLGVFIPLSANDLALLCQDPELKAKYLDGITFMHDLVAPYSDYQSNSYFEYEEALIACGTIKDKYFKGKDTLAKHFKYNFETASYYGSQGISTIGAESVENINRMRKDATAYINALLYTYNIVRTTE